MLQAILTFYSESKEALAHDRVYLEDVMNMKSIYKLSRMKYVLADQVDNILDLVDEIKDEIETIKQGGESNA